MTNPIQPDALDRWWAQHGNGPRFSLVNRVTVDAALNQYHWLVRDRANGVDVGEGYTLDDPELVACVSSTQAAFDAQWKRDHEPTTANTEAAFGARLDALHESLATPGLTTPITPRNAIPTQATVPVARKSEAPAPAFSWLSVLTSLFGKRR